MYTPSTRSWPAGLPSCSVLSVMSRMSSTIWNTIPKAVPHSVSPSIVGRSSPATMPPMRAAVPYSEAVLPWIEAK